MSVNGSVQHDSDDSVAGKKAEYGGRLLMLLASSIDHECVPDGRIVSFVSEKEDNQLLASVDAVGVIEPVIVASPAELAKYKINVKPGCSYGLLCGRRRLAAHKSSKHAKHMVPAREIELKKHPSLYAATENAVRKDLAWVERALLAERLRREEGLDEKTVAEALGCDVSYIRHMLRVVTAPFFDECVRLDAVEGRPVLGVKAAIQVASLPADEQVKAYKAKAKELAPLIDGEKRQKKSAQGGDATESPFPVRGARAIHEAANEVRRLARESPKSLDADWAKAFAAWLTCKRQTPPAGMTVEIKRGRPAKEEEE